MKDEVLDLLRHSAFYAEYLSLRFPNAPLVDVIQEGTNRLQPLFEFVDPAPVEDDEVGA